MTNRFFRLAPTPSGFIHAGNAFNFRLTAERCRQAGGVLRLRIDDLDQQRVRPEYLQNIFDALQELGISWQEGPGNVEEQKAFFSQTLRLPRYNDLLAELVRRDKVFACRCSRAQVAAQSREGHYSGLCEKANIPLDAPDVTWRVRTPAGSKGRFRDRDGAWVKADLAVENPFFVVRRRDGLPAYHIASLADDVDYGITDIVRGEDLRSSTFTQAYLAGMLQLEPFLNICFEHHPLLLGEDGEKLSKSAGAKALVPRQKKAG